MPIHRWKTTPTRPLARRVIVPLLLAALPGCCLEITGSPGGPCPAGEVRVNGACVPAGNACGASTVWLGDTCVTQDCTENSILRCQTADGGLGICAGGGCFDLLMDPANCGAYGLACPPSTPCVDGTCEANEGGPYYGCGPPRSMVSAWCVLPTCSAGTENQQCSGGAGPGPGICCGGECVTQGPDNCGACGLKCSSGAACNQCLSGGSYCEVTGCVPAASSCVDAGFGSTCKLDDGRSGLCCDHGCTDVLSDPANCGSCGQPATLRGSCGGGLGVSCYEDTDCPAGSRCWGFPMSDSRSCWPLTCDDRSQGDYCLLWDGGTGTCCDKNCVPIDSTCGCQTCGDGEFCGPAGCMPYVDCASEQPPLTAIEDPEDWGCRTDAGGLGVCCGPACVTVDNGCTEQSRCSASVGGDCELGEGVDGACCGDVCVDLEQDPKNCGQCGNLCPSGICGRESGQFSFTPEAACLPADTGGACAMSCLDGFTCLQGSCVVTACPAYPNALELCQAENGTIGFCCALGVCAHPLDDPENCGTCGNACRPGDACVNGSCTDFAGCGIGHLYWFCGDAGDTEHVCCPSAGCTDVLNDPQNCGTCRAACPPEDVCLHGTCSPG